MIKISPSILSADFARLGEECARICGAGADLLHVDVMDGCFVPNLTIGAPVIRCIKPYSSVPLDVHLMIDRPERYLDDFVTAGASIVTVHAEATQKIDEILARLSASGVKASLSIKPDTPSEVVFPYLDRLAMVLVMTVDPGFAGQQIIPAVFEKIKKVREMVYQSGKEIDIQVDGQVNENSAQKLVECGANVLVLGSSGLFKFDPSEYNEAVTKYKSLL